MYSYNGVINRIIDGDTYEVNIDLGFKVHLLQTVRLARINCPEVSTKEGKLAKEYAQGFSGLAVKINTTGKDKYGRYIAEIITTKNGKETNISDLLVSVTLAKYQEY